MKLRKDQETVYASITTSGHENNRRPCNLATFCFITASLSSSFPSPHYLLHGDGSVSFTPYIYIITHYYS